jgi:hypothetical protein
MKLGELLTQLKERMTRVEPGYTTIEKQPYNLEIGGDVEKQGKNAQIVYNGKSTTLGNLEPKVQQTINKVILKVPKTERASFYNNDTKNWDIKRWADPATKKMRFTITDDKGRNWTQMWDKDQKRFNAPEGQKAVQ